MNPLNRRLYLNAIQIALSDDALMIVRNSHDIARGLSEHWGPVFSKKDVDIDAAHVYLREHAKPWDFSCIREPTTADYRTFLRRVRHSAPGPDGLAYCFWHFAGHHAAETLFLVDVSLKAGQRAPTSFNESIMVFPPKGDSPHDDAEVIRSPSNVRPISLNNCDNKTVCGVNNALLREAASLHVPEIQRGFIGDRQLADNIIDLDADARIYSFESAPGDNASLAFWDIAAAFPSLQHAFIWLVLEAIGLPQGLLLFLQAIYHLNICRIAGFVAFTILGGALQGCH